MSSRIRKSKNFVSYYRIEPKRYDNCQVKNPHGITCCAIITFEDIEACLAAKHFQVESGNEKSDRKKGEF